jgi:hypothetical protein
MLIVPTSTGSQKIFFASQSNRSNTLPHRGLLRHNISLTSPQNAEKSPQDREIFFCFVGIAGIAASEMMFPDKRFAAVAIRYAVVGRSCRN